MSGRSSTDTTAEARLSSKVFNQPSYRRPPDLNLSEPSVDEDEESKTPLAVNVQKATKFFGDPRDQNNRIYPMYSKQKGVAVIINNQEFSDKDAYPFRTGADVDAKNLEKLFFQLGFQVKKYTNMRRTATLMMLIDLADSFLSQPCDMLIICILSHGEEQGKIVTSDGYFMDAEADVFRRFNNESCPGLKGKPKFFIVQACRGVDKDFGTPMGKTPSKDEIDATGVNSPPGAAPGSARYTKDVTWEDMLIANSTLPGYVSYRDIYRGTWFIECICEVFMENAKDMDLRDMLDLTAMKLREYESEAGTKQSFGYEVRHFYKKLYFNPGLFFDGDGVIEDLDDKSGDIGVDDSNTEDYIDRSVMSFEESVQEAMSMVKISQQK